MILTGSEIVAQIVTGNIDVDPFDATAVNPNSYNYRLGNKIKEINSETPIDTRCPFEVDAQDIPEEGIILSPNRHYLSHTLERIGSKKFVPSLIGRSSMGRLGLFLQISADLGNLGSCHRWTLELMCVEPIRIYPGMRIGQVSFWMAAGDTEPYRGQLGQFNEPKLPLEFGA
jgi:dCTP deaminase